MANNPAEFIKDIMSEPLGNLIAAIGKGVGEAQAALDFYTLQQTLELYKNIPNTGQSADTQTLMRNIGYQPTFYAIPETEVEAQISLNFSTDTPPQYSDANNRKSKVYAMPINATNVNKFNLNGNAFAKIKFKIVPVPPDAAISDMRVVPNLIDQIYNDTLINQIKTQGFEISVSNNVSDFAGKKISKQTPLADTLAKIGDVIIVELM